MPARSAARSTVCWSARCRPSPGSFPLRALTPPASVHRPSSRSSSGPLSLTIIAGTRAVRPDRRARVRPARRRLRFRRSPPEVTRSDARDAPPHLPYTRAGSSYGSHATRVTRADGRGGAGIVHEGRSMWLPAPKMTSPPSASPSADGQRKRPGRPINGMSTTALATCCREQMQRTIL
jgi:hypothetical protein